MTITAKTPVQDTEARPATFDSLNPRTGDVYET
jgi:hypothetical protein